MALARKPKMKEERAPAADEQEINAIIEKGGSVAAARGSNGKKHDGKQKQPVVIHIPADWLNEIDQIIGERRIKTPRHTWLLEAIAEKLDREDLSK